MQRALLAACLAFQLLAWPVHGQSAPASSSPRVVVDATGVGGGWRSLADAHATLKEGDVRIRQRLG